MHELAGVDLPLTQELLAQMMGVRRTSVTAVAGDLQKAGMISYRPRDRADRTAHRVHPDNPPDVLAI
jgi:Mn-dependent DtxR family transcriptional regulator